MGCCELGLVLRSEGDFLGEACSGEVGKGIDDGIQRIEGQLLCTGESDVGFEFPSKRRYSREEHPMKVVSGWEVIMPTSRGSRMAFSLEQL